MKYSTALAFALSASGALAAPTTYAAPADDGTKPSDKVCSAYRAYRTCQGGPDANQSFCASQFAGASGVQPYEGSGKTTSVAPDVYFANLQKNCPAAQPTPGDDGTKPSDKVCQAYVQLRNCQGQPSANQAFCASQFAGAAQVQPYEGSGKTTSVAPDVYFANLQKNCPAAQPKPTSSAAPAPSKTPAAQPPADKGYGSYGTYEKYPTHYASEYQSNVQHLVQHLLIIIAQATESTTTRPTRTTDPTRRSRI